MGDTTRIGQSILPQQYEMSEAPVEMTPVTGDVSVSGLSALLNGQNGMPQVGQVQDDEEAKQAGVFWTWAVSTAVVAFRRFFIPASYLWFNTEGWRASQYEAIANHYDKNGDLKEARLNYEKARDAYRGAKNSNKANEMQIEVFLVTAKEKAAAKDLSGALREIDAASEYLFLYFDDKNVFLAKIITTRNTILVAEAKSLPDAERARAIELLRTVVGNGATIDTETAELLMAKLRSEGVAQLVKGETQRAILLYQELEALLQLNEIIGSGELREVRELLYEEFRLLATEHLSGGNFRGAESAFDDAIAVAGKFSGDWAEDATLAKTHMQVEVAEKMLSTDGPYDEAVRMLDEAYKSWPPARYELSASDRDSLDLTAQAKKLLAEALVKDGIYKLRAGDFAAAEAQYLRAIPLQDDEDKKARLFSAAGRCCRESTQDAVSSDGFAIPLDRASGYYLEAYKISRRNGDLHDFALCRMEYALATMDGHRGAELALSSLDAANGMLDSVHDSYFNEIKTSLLDTECGVLEEYPEMATEERLARMRGRLDFFGEQFPDATGVVRDRLGALDSAIPERLLREWIEASTGRRTEQWSFLERVLGEHPSFESSPAFNTPRFQDLLVALREKRAALRLRAPGKVK